MYPYKYSANEKYLKNGDSTIFVTEYIPEISCGSVQSGKKGCPAVILSHGYNSVGSDIADAAKIFAENGFYACCFDFCGGSTRSKSSGKTTEMSIETEKRDLLAVMDMVSTLDITDSGRIYLYGESQGGFVSALTAADIPEKTAGLFMLYPAFCIPDHWLCRNESELDPPFDFMGMVLSKKFYDEVPRYDVFDYISRFNKPVMIFHGDSDGLVNLSYSEKLIKSFPSASLTVIPGAGHGFAPDVRARITNEICRFINSQAND